MKNILKGLFNKSKLTTEEATGSLAGVRDYYANHPSHGLNPKKLAAILLQAEQGEVEAYLELAEEMEEKEPQYLATLGTRKRAIMQMDITVLPYDDLDTSLAHAELVKDFFRRDTLEQELFDILDAIGKGFSVVEIIWEFSSSRWMPKELKWVDPRWITFDMNNPNIPLLKTENGPQPLSPFKYIYTTIKAKSGTDIRGGLARTVAWYYMFKNFDIKNWISFLEVYGHPMRVGKYGKTATSDDKKALLRAVMNIGADAAAIISEDMQIEFIKNENKSTTDAFQSSAAYFDQAISKIVLGQTTTTDAISGGHAVSKEHNEVRLDIAKSDANQLAAVLKKYLVKPIIDLNFGVQENYPDIKIGNAEPEDVKSLVDAINILVPFGLKISQRQMLEKLNLNPPEDEDDVLSYQQNAQTSFLGLNKALNKKALNTYLIDDLTNEALEDWEEIIEPVEQQVSNLIDELIKQGKGLEELKQELVKLDIPADKLAQSLTQNSILAHELGKKANAK